MLSALVIPKIFIIELTFESTGSPIYEAYVMIHAVAEHLLIKQSSSSRPILLDSKNLKNCQRSQWKGAKMRAILCHACLFTCPRAINQEPLNEFS
jgi:hypothetical protein